MFVYHVNLSPGNNHNLHPLPYMSRRSCHRLLRWFHPVKTFRNGTLLTRALFDLQVFATHHSSISLIWTSISSYNRMIRVTPKWFLLSKTLVLVVLDPLRVHHREIQLTYRTDYPVDIFSEKVCVISSTYLLNIFTHLCISVLFYSCALGTVRSLCFGGIYIFGSYHPSLPVSTSV